MKNKLRLLGIYSARRDLKHRRVAAKKSKFRFIENLRNKCSDCCWHGGDFNVLVRACSGKVNLEQLAVGWEAQNGERQRVVPGIGPHEINERWLRKRHIHLLLKTEQGGGGSNG